MTLIADARAIWLARKSPRGRRADLLRVAKTGLKTHASAPMACARATPSMECEDMVTSSAPPRRAGASRSGPTLYWKIQEGLEPSPGPVDTSLGEFKRMAEALKRFRAVVLTGEVAAGRPGWTEVADGGTVVADRKLGVRTL